MTSSKNIEQHTVESTASLHCKATGDCSSLTKNQRIAATCKETRERRKNQDCKVFELKVDKSHLNQTIIDLLDKLFLEAKWFYNYAISRKNICDIDYKIKKVDIKTKTLRIGNEESEDSFVEIFEKRELTLLGSQIKTGIIKRIECNINGLSTLKNKSVKIGKLRYKSFVNSIPLDQFRDSGNSAGAYRIKNKEIKIQNFKKYLRVNGIEQLTGYEIANAKFIRRNGDFYFHVTCFKNKEEAQSKRFQEVGLDFGIKSQLTMSCGVSLQYEIPITKKLKRLARKLNKKKYQSKNYYKALEKLQKEYAKLTNQKKDVTNKIFNVLKTNFEHIAFQNDNLQGWQHIWGRRMLNTSIGGIMSNLKRLPTAVEVDRWFASTKQCRICGQKQKIGLEERTFNCKNCGHKEDRDLHSARSILAQSKIGTEYTESTLAGDEASTFILEKLNTIPHLKASFVDEPRS